MAHYPKVDIQVSCAAKLSVADLERDGHLVILVKGLVEAFAAVGGQLYVVGRHGREQPGCCKQQRRC